MTWRVVVASRGRAATIAGDTLTALYGVPADRITVLAYAPEIDAYRAVCPDVDVQPAPAGLGAVNALVADRWPCEWVIRLDDDILHIDALREQIPSLAPADPVALFDDLTARGDAAKVTLVGISRESDAYRLSRDFTTGLRFIPGGLYAFRPDPALVARTSALEGYERTLLHYERDGAVGFAGWVTVHSRRCRVFPGGIADELPDRPAAEQADAEALIARWPHLIRRLPDWHGYPELQLADDRDAP